MVVRGVGAGGQLASRTCLSSVPSLNRGRTCLAALRPGLLRLGFGLVSTCELIYPCASPPSAQGCPLFSPPLPLRVSCHVIPEFLWCLWILGWSHWQQDHEAEVCVLREPQVWPGKQDSLSPTWTAGENLVTGNRDLPQVRLWQSRLAGSSLG